MGKYKIEITDTAIKYLHHHKKSGNTTTINKIETIILELSEHPYTGTGQPEALKYQLR